MSKRFKYAIFCLATVVVSMNEIATQWCFCIMSGRFSPGRSYAKQQLWTRALIFLTPGLLTSTFWYSERRQPVKQQFQIVGSWDQNRRSKRIAQIIGCKFIGFRVLTLIWTLGYEFAYMTLTYEFGPIILSRYVGVSSTARCPFIHLIRNWRGDNCTKRGY